MSTKFSIILAKYIILWKKKKNYYQMRFVSFCVQNLKHSNVKIRVLNWIMDVYIMWAWFSPALKDKV